MAFESMYLEEDIHIDRIYTIHYLNTKVIFTLQENAIISGNFNV